MAGGRGDAAWHQHARFAPARDATGAAHEGVYNGANRWQIHED